MAPSLYNYHFMTCLELSALDRLVGMKIKSASVAAQSFVFPVRWVCLQFLEACGGVMQQNTLVENIRCGRIAV